MRKDSHDNVIVGQVNNIAQLTIIYENQYSYNNGEFSVVFNKEFDAIACSKDITQTDLRVLIHMVTNMDRNNRITVTIDEVASSTHCSRSSIYRALNKLVNMQIICQKAGSSHEKLFELSSKLINPRLAFHGNSRKLKKHILPELLSPDGKTGLIPGTVLEPYEEFWNDNDGGE